MSNISNFAKNFQGGVRPNQFEVTVQSSPVGAIDFKFLGNLHVKLPFSVQYPFTLLAIWSPVDL